MAAVKEKSLRWELVSPQFREGRVFFRRGAAWLPDVIDELVTVPASAHDDMTDALAQAIEHLRGRGIRWTLQAVADWVASDKEAANAAPAAPSSKSTPPTAEGSPEPSREQLFRTAGGFGPGGGSSRLTNEFFGHRGPV